MKKALKHCWDNLELFLMVIFLDAFLINVFLQILTRLFINQPLSFTEEVSRYLFVWMVFLALPFATRYDKHIAMDIFVRKLPDKVQFVLKMLIHIITILVFLWVVYYGIDYLIFCKNVKTPVLQISKAIVAAIIPLSGTLMIIRTIERIFIDAKLLKSGKLGKSEPVEGGTNA